MPSCHRAAALPGRLGPNRARGSGGQRAAEAAARESGAGFISSHDNVATAAPWRWGTPASVDHRVTYMNVEVRVPRGRGRKSAFGLSPTRVFACRRQWLHLRATPLLSMPLDSWGRLLPRRPGLAHRNETAPPERGYGRQSAPSQYNLKGDVRARPCHAVALIGHHPRHLATLDATCDTVGVGTLA